MKGIQIIAALALLAEVLRIATWNGATYAKQLADRGSIERGKRADLILVDGDPTTDISAIRNVALVLQDGDFYSPAELYGELGITPFAPALLPQVVMTADSLTAPALSDEASGSVPASFRRALFGR